jgi:AAA15 family ATPase/GTPase
MPHIEELVIHGYRNLRNLNFKNLGQFNILVGMNNSGKTSALEGIELFCHPLDIRQFLATSRSRDRIFFGPRKTPLLDSVAWMFPINPNKSFNEDINRDEIYISGIVNNRIIKVQASFSEIILIEPNIRNSIFINKNKNVNEDLSTDEIRAFNIIFKYQGPGSGLFYKEDIEESIEFVLSEYTPITQNVKEKVSAIAPTKMITPVDHRVIPISAKSLSNTIKSGDKPKIIELLKSFDKNIKGIEILSPDGRNSIPYLIHSKLGYVPISVFGDGLRRTITFASMLLQCRDGILLIDELETAVHVQALEYVFTWLINACIKYNVQLFATTHSIEAVDAILKAMSSNNNILHQLVTYRLETKANTSIAKRFPGKSLYDLRYELGQDVR